MNVQARLQAVPFFKANTMKHTKETIAILENQEIPVADENSLWGGEGVLIHSYTRQQAIADGCLIDVTEAAHEEGFRYPFALTQAAWCTSIRKYQSADNRSETQRLKDMFHFLRVRIAANQCRTSTIIFSVAVVGEQAELGTVRLKAICGPGDNAEPVITVMLPDED